jgi:hypothetical protein
VRAAVLNTLRAYSTWESAVIVPLEPLGRAESDLFQIRNVDGLGPVTAAISTSPLGSMDGDTFVGSSVGSRNIVLTIKPNPDWNTWTYEKLRHLLYLYFMPKKLVRLVFETDEFPSVEIYGYVESNEPKIFSKDGEIQVSVICPYPYFTSVEPVILTGTRPDEIDLDYAGTIETGFQLQMDYVFGAAGAYNTIQITRAGGVVEAFRVESTIDANNYFRMSSVPGQKYVQSIAVSSGVISNLLSDVDVGSVWPYLEPGFNTMAIGGDGGLMNYTLTYYNRYGGL